MKPLVTGDEVWARTLTGRLILGAVTEVGLIKKAGDQERYRITGLHCDCWFFRSELTSISALFGGGSPSGHLRRN